MRCPACKSTITSADAVSKVKGETYKCTNCGARSTSNFDWKLLLLLALVAAPVLEVLVQFILQSALKHGFGAASKDVITLISMISTAAILIAAYSYLRRPKLIRPDSTE